MAKKFTPITADTWTQIKGKEVSKTLRGLMPSKKEIFNKDGTLKISQSVYNTLVVQIDAARKSPLKPERDEITKRFKKAPNPVLAIDKLIKKLADNQKSLSADEKALLAAVQIRRTHMDPGVAKMAQGKAKSANILHSSVYYEVQYFLDEGTFDVDEVDDDNIEEILILAQNGDINLSDEDEKELRRRLKEYNGESDEEEDENKEQTITPTVNSEVEKVASVILRDYSE